MEGEEAGEEAGEGEGEGEEAEGDVSYAAAAAAARAEADAKALAAGAAPGEEAEAEGADDDGDMMVAEVGEVVGGDQVDRRLWTGAAQEGWSMQPSGRGGRRREAAAWAFVGPSGVLYADKAEASSKRAQESADAAAAAKSSLQKLPPVAENPTELPGCRISTFWEDEDGGGGGTWYGAQVMSYDAKKDTFDVLYDDGSLEEGVDLKKERIKLLYRMTPPALARSRWPPRPAISDITAVNWPLFLAAAAVRLLAQDEPDLPLSDEPGTAAPAADAMEVDAAAAAPAAAPAAAAAAAASDDDDSDDDLSLTAKVDPAKAAAEKKAAAAAAAEKARVAAAAAAAAAARRAALAPVQRAVSALLCVHPSEVLKTFAALDASCKLALLRVACEAACRASVVEGAMRAKEERREELGRRWEAEEKEERKRKREEREARRAEVRQTLEREGEVNELLVAERMRRLDQEEAVGKTTHVFTRDELAAAEGDRAMELDVAAAGVDESGNQLGAAQVAAAEARRDEMRKRLDRLGASRDAAEERLLQAVDDGKLGDGAAGAANLEAALEAARGLALEGSHTADGVGPPTAARWMTAAVRDAYVALAECKTRAAGGERDHERLRELARVGGVRAEPLGVDRWGRRYWDFDGAAAAPAAAAEGDGGGGGGDGGGGGGGGGDDEEPSVWVQPCVEEMGGTLVGTPPDAGGDGGAWQYFRGADALRALAASLDPRGVRERALQSALLHRLRRVPPPKPATPAAAAPVSAGAAAAAAAVGLGGVPPPMAIAAAARAAVNGGA